MSKKVVVLLSNMVSSCSGSPAGCAEAGNSFSFYHRWEYVVLKAVRSRRRHRHRGGRYQKYKEGELLS